MRAVVPLHFVRLDQPHIDFPDQCRGLEGVAIFLASHVALRHTVKLVINDLRELFERKSISSAPCVQQLGNLGRRRRAHRFIREFSISFILASVLTVVPETAFETANASKNYQVDIGLSFGR